MSRRPETSDEAWARVVPRLSELRQRVLAAFREHGSLSDETGVRVTGMEPSTYRTRRSELVEMGWLRDSGSRRELRTGGRGVVWTLTGEIGDVAPPRAATRKTLERLLRRALEHARHDRSCPRGASDLYGCTCGLSRFQDEIPEEYLP